MRFSIITLNLHKLLGNCSVLLSSMTHNPNSQLYNNTNSLNSINLLS